MTLWHVHIFNSWLLARQTMMLTFCTNPICTFTNGPFFHNLRSAYTHTRTRTTTASAYRYETQRAVTYEQNTLIPCAKSFMWKIFIPNDFTANLPNYCKTLHWIHHQIDVRFQSQQKKITRLTDTGTTTRPIQMRINRQSRAHFQKYCQYRWYS